METLNNSIFGIHQKPLKYVLINNRKALELLSNTGALSIYDNDDNQVIPSSIDNISSSVISIQGDKYRELYASNLFIAAGYGAKSRTEQLTLSYIANNYKTNYLTLNNSITNTYNYAYTGITTLNNTKVNWIKSGDVHTKILSSDNTNNTINYTSKNQTDISLNTFDFFNDGSLIPLYELKNHLQFNVLQDLVISNIDFKAYLKDDPDQEHFYTNYSYVPIDAQIKKFVITITGNTNDSGGINGLTIKYNHDSEQEPNTHDRTSEINQNNLDDGSTVPASNHQNFVIQVTRQYDDGQNTVLPFTITGGTGSEEYNNENYLISDIIIKVKATDTSQYDSQIVDQNQLITDHDIVYSNKIFVLYGLPSIVYYEGNTSNTQNESLNHKTQLLYANDKSQLLKSFKLSFTEFIINENNNTSINKFYILLKKKFGAILSIKYYDYITHSISDILYLCTLEETNNEYKYIFTCDNEDNEIMSNLPFISNNNGQYYFNKGVIKVECTEHITDNNYIDRLNSNVWISTNNNDNTLDILQEFLP